MKGTRWTPQQVKTLKAEYGQTPNPDLASKLNKTEYAIRRKAHTLKLSTHTKKVYDDDYLRENLGKMSYKALSEATGVSLSKLYWKAHSLGITGRKLARENNREILVNATDVPALLSEGLDASKTQVEVTYFPEYRETEHGHFPEIRKEQLKSCKIVVLDYLDDSVKILEARVDRKVKRMIWI